MFSLCYTCITKNMNKNFDTKRISVIGSCVCRDLFEKAPDEFSFFTDIRFTSPISMLAEPASFINETFDDLYKKVETVNGKWYKKNLINDINKTAFKSLKEKHGDYLALDFAESRMPIAILSWLNKDEKLLVSNSISFREHYIANLSKNIFKEANISFMNPLDFSDECWKKTIEDFAINIKNIFKEENIILIKNMPAKYFVDIHGHLHPYYSSYHFNSILLCNLLLDKLNNYFLNICPNCKVIEIPPYAIGKQNHKWGNHPFHFTDVYYEYLLKCVQSITNKNNDENLKKIYEEYKIKFKNAFDEIALKTAKEDNSNASYELNEILKENEDYNHLGKKQKALILFALDKKHFIKNFKKMYKEDKKK